MVWKQDLAQLKQHLKPDQEPAGPPPKPVQPPLPSQSLEDADLLFLRAMGGVAVPTAPTTGTSNKGTAEDSSPTPVFAPTSIKVSRALAFEDSSDDFSQALGDMKGLRPLSENPVFSAPGPSEASLPAVFHPQSSEVQAPVPAPIPAIEQPPEIPSIQESENSDVPIAPQEVPHIRTAPVLIHLAAGMAVEVDGTLDLRRHTLNDAKDRLKERISDGLALHWRTLLVTLGPSEALKQGFLAFLTTPQAQFINRYAQAPIPMGGAQAWVLYLGQQAQLIRKPLPQNNSDIDNGGPV